MSWEIGLLRKAMFQQERIYGQPCARPGQFCLAFTIGSGYIAFFSGCGSVWLERSVRDAEAACSNHAIPTREFRHLQNDLQVPFSVGCASVTCWQCLIALLPSICNEMLFNSTDTEFAAIFPCTPAALFVIQAASTAAVPMLANCSSFQVVDLTISSNSSLSHLYSVLISIWFFVV